MLLLLELRLLLLLIVLLLRLRLLILLLLRRARLVILRPVVASPRWRVLWLVGRVLCLFVRIPPRIVEIRRLIRHDGSRRLSICELLRLQLQTLLHVLRLAAFVLAHKLVVAFSLAPLFLTLCIPRLACLFCIPLLFTRMADSQGSS